MVKSAEHLDQLVVQIRKCARHWRWPLLEAISQGELSNLLGKYALDWRIGKRDGASLTETVHNWREYWPQNMPLPHPSPRNNHWLKRNPWFEAEVIPVLQHRVGQLLGNQ